MSKTNNNTKKDDRPVKFERIYEDEETIAIWKYDLNKTQNGPVEVEIKYKKGYQHPKPQGKKTLKDHVDAEKKNIKKKGS
jgi:hypothetical protein